MSREDEFFELKKEYESIQPPAELLERMQASMNDARAAVQRRKVVSIVRNTAIGAAAAAAVFVLPNSDSNVATAMGKIPLIGGLIRVVTVRNYDIQDEDTDIDVKVPELQVAEGSEEKDIETTESKAEEQGEKETVTEGTEETDAASTDVVSDAAQEINSQVDDYTSRLLAEYNKADGKVGIVSRHWVVTDDDDWFTLGLLTTVSKADTTEAERYYHIDKNTGKAATLKDAFIDGADYVSVINKQIQSEIAKQPGRFFTKEDAKQYGDSCFTTITADQNFYFDSKGNVVIVFDECTIAPASEGIVRFTVSASSLKDILKYSVARDRQGSSSGAEAGDSSVSTGGAVVDTGASVTTEDSGSTGGNGSTGAGTSTGTGASSGTGSAGETGASETETKPAEDEEIDVAVDTEPEVVIEVGVEAHDEDDIDADTVVVEVEVEEVVEIAPRRPEGASRPVTSAAADTATDAAADVAEDSAE